MNAYEQFKRDTAVLNVIKEHKGKENSISAKDLVKEVISKGYEMTVTNCGHIVERLIFERHVPICSIKYHGYYWAETTKDIEDCVNCLRSSVNTTLMRIDILESFIIK